MQGALLRIAVATMVAGVAVAAAVGRAAVGGQHPLGLPALAGCPDTLRETGLFRDDVSTLSFTPQYPLWSDGATKRRWIYLPPGTSIDASNPDAWVFPVGTRVWKELSFHGARVETRFMQRTADGWQYATYVWSADGREATRAPVDGDRSVEIAPSVRHRIPSEADCRACHATGPTAVLAFSALQLSPERDPGAPHREAPHAGDVDLFSLVDRGLVRGLPPHLRFVAPRIPGPAIERSALGYLHANCGGCHRLDGGLANIGMELAYRLASPDGARRTAVGVDAHISRALRIAPGDHAASVAFRRMNTRVSTVQMPPLGTLLVDAEATLLLARWIDQLALNNQERIREQETGR